MKRKGRTCNFVMDNGKTCKSYPLKDDPDGMCYFHSSKTKNQLALTTQKGGLVRTGDFGKDIEVKSSADVIALLNATANALKSGKIDSKTANSMVYCANVLLKSLYQGVIEKQVQELVDEQERNRLRGGYQLAQDEDSIE